MKLTTDVEFADIDCPIKPPRIVKEFGNIFVLISILILPTSCISVSLTAQHVPSTYRTFVIIAMAIGFFLAWAWLPLYVAKSKASRWLLSIIQYYIHLANVPEASRIACKYARAISFTDFSTAKWFQTFLLEQGIRDNWGVYERYLMQVPPTGQ